MTHSDSGEDDLKESDFSVDIVRLSVDGEWDWVKDMEITQFVLVCKPEISDKFSNVVIVLGTSDISANLNFQFRGKQGETDVLSFPSLDGPAFDGSLGDVVLSFAPLREFCEVHHCSLIHRLAHLLIHGILHLCGFTHEFDSDFLVMSQKEKEYLSILGFSDPYGD